MHTDNPQKHSQTTTKYLNQSDNIAPFRIDIQKKDAEKKSSPFEFAGTLEHQVVRVIQEIIPEFLLGPDLQEALASQEGWSNLNLDDKLVIESLTGGLSNHLLVVSRKEMDKQMTSQDSGSDGTLYMNMNRQSKILVRIKAGESTCMNDNCAAEEKESESASASTCSTKNYEYKNDQEMDIDTENRISALLSLHGIAPVYYGRFENGRLEEFYDSMRTLSCREMLTRGQGRECGYGYGCGYGCRCESKSESQPEYIFNRAIATKMARFHKFKLPESELTIPSRHLDHENGMDSNQEDGDVWSRIHGWIQTLRRSTNDDSSSASLPEMTGDSTIQRAEHELSWLRCELGLQQKKDESLSSAPAVSSKLEESSSASLSMDGIRERARSFMREIVFAHMDLQSLNILTPATTTTNGDIHEHQHKSHDIIRLIDFEYAGMNARSIDIANTFLECCDMNNLRPDYEAEYPSCEEQNVFLETYVREYDPLLAQELDSISRCSSSAGAGDSGADGGALSWGTFLSTARAEVGKATLVSHLGWACWSLVQLQESSIDFDFAKYAEIRWNGYNFFKAKYFGQNYNASARNIQP